ncbi:MAG TPA: hypothetical protein VHO03_16945 [Ignavibacteriales bacterium]|nr:hypothetical protein [Ignavibacteriales bacterium]
MDQLRDFTVQASSFGGELDISWQYPIVMPPEGAKVYVFKRSKTDVTEDEIAEYFRMINNLEGFNYNGLMVFDNLPLGAIGFIDIKVLNDTKHYYKAVLRDDTTGELSLSTGANGTPKPSIKTQIKDGKELVRVAIEKMLDNVYDAKGVNVKLGKDIKIEKNFSIDPVFPNYIMIERVNGSSQYRFWNNDFARYGGSLMKGDIDVDVIRATFITTESPDRRDKVTNIFRAYKPFLIYVIKMLGAKDVSVNVEGDYYNPEIHGINAVGTTVIFSVVIENLMKLDVQKVDVILRDIKVIEE